MLRMTVSAFIGVASHLVLDGLTHEGGWGPRLFPLLLRNVGVFGARLPIVRTLQYGASVVLSLVTLALLWRLRPEPSGEEADPRGRSVIVGAACVGAPSSPRLTLTLP